MSLLPLGALGITIAALNVAPEPSVAPAAATPTTLVAEHATTTQPPLPTTTNAAPDASAGATSTIPLAPSPPAMGAAPTCTTEIPAGALHVDATSTSDAPTGSADAPYRSLAAAYDAVAAGGAIVVHPGTYRTALGRADNDGWVPKRIHLLGAPGGPAPVIAGTDEMAWRNRDDVWTTDFDNRFDPGDVRGGQLFADRPDAAYQEQVFVDGVALRQVLQANRLDTSSFHHDRWSGTLSISIDPTERLVEVSTRRRAALFAPEAAGSSLECLRFEGFSPAHRDGFAAVVIDADDMTLTDVTITQSAGTGLGVFAENVRLERVTVVENGAVGATVHRADGFDVVDSAFDQNNAATFQWIGCGARCVLAGMKITATTSASVRNSRFAGNLSTGLWCDLGCRDVAFEHNLVLDNAKHGIFYEVSRSGAIVDNVIAGNGGTGLRIPGSDTTVAARNIFLTNGTHVVVADDLRSPSEFADAGGDTDPSEIELVENVFAEDDAAATTVLDLFNSTAESPALGRFSTLDRNCYLLNGDVADRFVVPEVGSWSSVQDFHARTGFATAAIVADHVGSCGFDAAEVCHLDVVERSESLRRRLC